MESFMRLQDPVGDGEKSRVMRESLEPYSHLVRGAGRPDHVTEERGELSASHLLDFFNQLQV